MPQAISLMETAQAAGARGPEYSYHLGMAYAKNGQEELAKEQLGKALADENAAFYGRDKAEEVYKGLSDKRFTFRINSAMPLQPMDAAATSAATQTAGDDLRYNRAENRLSEHAQTALATLGCGKIRRMARFAEAATRLRAALETQLALGEPTSVGERI